MNGEKLLIDIIGIHGKNINEKTCILNLTTNNYFGNSILNTFKDNYTYTMN